MMAEVAHVVPSSAGCRRVGSLRALSSALIQVDINHNGPSRGHHVDIALTRGHSVDIHLDARDHHVRARSPTLPCEHLSVYRPQSQKYLAWQPIRGSLALCFEMLVQVP